MITIKNNVGARYFVPLQSMFGARLVHDTNVHQIFSALFTMISSIFSSERTALVLFDGAQGALNLHATPFFFLQVVV